MLVAKENRMVTMTGKELKLYTFRANFNPIYGIEEPELTTIQIPAADEKHAWERLGFLLGSQSKISWFRLAKVQEYESSKESLDLWYMVADEVEHKGLDESITDKAIRYIKDNDRLMQMLDLIVYEAISACS